MLKAYRYSVPTTVLAIALTSQLIAINPSYAEQGRTIQLNGQPWVGQWIKDNSSIYLQDDWMRVALGIELMDSDRPQAQRLRWFSVPFFAAVTYDQPVQRRFLDIKDISKEWRTEIVGEILRISTPNSLISSIRRSKQNYGQNFGKNLGDRIVIDLDRATPWQVQRDKNVISLAIAADLAANLPKSLNNQSGNLVKAVEIQSEPKQTIIKIQTTQPITPTIQTLGNPYRLIVDIQPTYQPPDLTIAWAKGLIRKQQTVTLVEAGQPLRFSVNSLIVNLKEPSISMRPIWSDPDGMVGTSSLRAIAEVWQAAGAINGGFFNRDRKMPVGAIRESKRWMAGGVLTRGAVAWNPSGNVFMDRLIFGEEIITNQGNIALTHLNSGFVQNGLARYTPNWGLTYTPLTENEVIFVITGDRITAQLQSGAAGDGKINIPDNGYLLVARKSPELLSRLSVGDQIKGITNIKPEAFSDFPNILGAGPLLLKNGNLVLDAALERFLPPFDTRGASRSAIATTNIPAQVLLTTIQATPEGILPSLRQTADILKKMGAVNALNLDGGGSTTLYLGGAILNRSVGSVAPVHNGLGIFINSTESLR
ncbi:Localisation of periplasmic protein complexes [Synechococcus sp. PCC 7502]|uniref:phosphodiester glycosidase family protein n=1 Tax=Synechococcus sp. PCC 7502 TaxID=1173263 RepID=UPI00029FB585|nr:phosphodiester glycosidase family protein [Synechococcus sp. PCC 7502]AFY72650.1 Localisation of periplasmic protein complexes [Synechococcus sp. PCC 7502]